MFKTVLGNTPRYTVNIQSGNNRLNSFRFKSRKLEIYFKFKEPKINLFAIQMEYAALKTIPNPQKKASIVLYWKTPTNIRSSPIKLQVPGILRLAKIKDIKKKENNGIICTIPP